MATIGDLVVNMRANTGPFSAGLRQGRSELGGFVGAIKSGVGSAVGSIAKITTIAGTLAGVGSIGAGLFQGFSDASNLEQSQIAFTTLFGDAQKAKELLSDLSSFAASTPFQLPQLTDASTKLAAFGFEANEILPTLRRLGDISAGLNQPVNEIAEIFGKIRVAGRVMGEDINQLVGRGIPIIGELAKQFGVTEGEVKALVSAGKVGFPEIQAAVENMTNEGGKFAGLMEAQSSSLGGIFSTMKDNVSFVFRDIAQLVIDAFDVKGAIDNMTSLAQSVRGSLESIRPTVMGIAESTFDAFEMIQSGAQTAFAILQTGYQNWQTIAELAGISAILGIESTANAFIHFFTGTLPGLLDWFSGNWREIFFSAGDFVLTVFANLGTNIRKMFSEVFDYIASAGRDPIEFDFVGLTEGFVNQIREMPELAGRELSALEKELMARRDELSSGLGEAFAANAQSAAKQIEDTAGKIADATGAGQAEKRAESGVGDGRIGSAVKEKTGAVAAVQAGTTEAFSAIMADRRQRTNPNKTLEDLQKKQIAKQEKTNSTLGTIAKNTGKQVVKVAPIGV